ncbi:hypothetical protein BC826DRAFT_1178451 [Russula brevipes]|nr:hypothetical protein BC826DRAFT_1178451 [Russula brevipes]
MSSAYLISVNGGVDLCLRRGKGGKCMPARGRDSVMVPTPIGLYYVSTAKFWSVSSRVGEGSGSPLGSPPRQRAQGKASGQAGRGGRRQRVAGFDNSGGGEARKCNVLNLTRGRGGGKGKGFAFGGTSAWQAPTCPANERTVTLISIGFILLAPRPFPTGSGNIAHLRQPLPLMKVDHNVCSRVQRDAPRRRDARCDLTNVALSTMMRWLIAWGEGDSARAGPPTSKSSDIIASRAAQQVIIRHIAYEHIQYNLWLSA